MKKILVAMSGGVDSSVAAALLLERGVEVIGVTMNLFEPPATGSPTSNPVVDDAGAVADFLSIPHVTVDAVDAFEDTVISYFVDEYRSGRTPNPCVVCNRYLKFGLLMDKARELGCDGLATGHYAVIDNGKLRRGVDAGKDQSYFLYPVLSAQTDKIAFPLGGLAKGEVRSLARKFNLPAADRSDSQDICFIPSGNYADFLKSRGIGVDSDECTIGRIVDINGNILGTHAGIHNFTVGQRKGLGALGKRMYVKRIDAGDNTVVAAEEHDLGCGDILIRDAVVSAAGIDVNRNYSVQVRYRSAPVSARVVGVDIDAGMDTDVNITAPPCRGDRPRSPAVSGTHIRIIFNEPVKAPSPGQSAVIYDGDEVVGGGIIC